MSRKMSLDVALAMPLGFPWFEPRTRYIVLRGTGSSRLEGMWFEREPASFARPPAGVTQTATATGRYERRDDGMLAEVFEVGFVRRPLAKAPRSVLTRLTPELE